MDNVYDHAGMWIRENCPELTGQELDDKFAEISNDILAGYNHVVYSGDFLMQIYLDNKLKQ